MTMDTWVYLVLLLGVFLGLVLFFVKNKKGEKDQQTIELLQSFAEEMVEENQKLLNRMVELNRQTDQKLAVLSNQVRLLQERVIALEQEPRTEVDKKSVEFKPIEQDILHLYDRYKEVFQLLEQGVAKEEVSKQLGYGKGELELILQLAGRK